MRISVLGCRSKPGSRTVRIPPAPRRWGRKSARCIAMHCAGTAIGARVCRNTKASLIFPDAKLAARCAVVPGCRLAWRHNGLRRGNPRCDGNRTVRQSNALSESRSRTSYRQLAMSVAVKAKLRGFRRPARAWNTCARRCQSWVSNSIESATATHIVGLTSRTRPVKSLMITKERKPHTMPSVIEYVSGIRIIAMNAGIASSN